MQNQCQDNYWTTFTDFGEMRLYHEKLAKESQWQRCKVSDLHVEPLDRKSPLFGDLAAFAPGISPNAVEDTADNLGLAISVDGQTYPVRGTAYKSLLDRAKISGSVLPKLSREKLARTLNDCLELFPCEALVLIRDEKVSATHSGDPKDYSVLPIDQLLIALDKNLQSRFPGAVFMSGYCDHAMSSASWTMPAQKEDLLGAYEKMLTTAGKAKMAAKLVPGIRFVTSDTGIASAKVSAMLMGTQYPIHIGSCVAVDHRHQTTVGDFEAALDQLFAQFADTVSQLQHLLEVHLDFPVNAMTRVCKRLALPKKAALEAIAMFEMAYGGGPATAHDVFMALQEIPCIMSSSTPESKMLTVEENLARALTLRWSDYDLAKAVSY